MDAVNYAVSKPTRNNIVKIQPIDTLSLDSDASDYNIVVTEPVNKPLVKSHHNARLRKKLHIGEFSVWSVDVTLSNMPVSEDELDMIAELPNVDFFVSDMLCTEATLLLNCDPSDKRAIKKIIKEFIKRVSDVMDYNVQANVNNFFVVADNWYCTFDY